MEQIKETEIMIGNWLVVKDNNQVCQITAINRLLGVQVNDNILCWAKFEDLIPIPLTEDILFKCGFRKEDYKKGHIGIDFKSGHTIMDFVLEEPWFMGEWNDCYTFELPSFRFLNVRYVHDLQNLFRVITQTDLKFKI